MAGAPESRANVLAVREGREGSARGDPAGVVRSKTAGGQHAVDMGMMLQSLR
jgi:hypothetical protein